MPSSPPPPPSRLPVFNGVHSPRSASDPFAAYGAAAAAAQRSSPSTSPDLAASARKDHHATSSTLPSIRSLRNAFQSLGHGKKSRQSTSGPRIVTGDEAAKGAPPSSPPTAGGNAGKSGGLFGFHRKVSHPESPPAPRFTAFVQRPSVDHSAPSPPSTSKSAPTSPLPTRAESPLPPIPTPLDSPPPEQHRQSTIAALGPSAASPQIVRKLHRRISSDFARAPSDTPLATLRASEPRSQSLNRRSRRISNRLSASSVFPPHKVGEPSGEDKRGRHVSASASLFSSARPAELKDDLAYRRLSINSQPSPVLNGGSPNLDKGTGWEKSKAQGGGWEPARSGTVAGVGLGVDDFPSQPPSRKYSTPFPSNFEPVPIQHLNPTKPPPVPPTGTAEPLPRPFRPISIAASSADRLSLASSIQRRYGPGSNSQRNSQDGSHYSRSPSVRSSSPANLQNVPRLASGPVGDSRLSTSSFQQAFPNDQQQEVLDIVAPPPPASSDTPLNTGSSPLMRSKSAIDSARAHGETTGQVESGSPVFVIPSDAFADAGEVGRRRSSASLRSLRKASVDGGDPEADEEWKEKKERRRSLRGQKAKSEGWGEQLKQMLAVGDWGQSLLGLGPPVETMPTPSSAEQDDDSTKDLVGVPESPATIAHGVAAREKGSGTNSPLDDLITELGGRRPSDVSSIGRPTASSLFSSRGSAAPTHVEAHPETVAEEHPSDQDLTSYPSPLKNRPPSAPPKFALPTTPIGALSPASGTVELQPPAMALEEDDDEQEILKTEPDPDRTLTLDEMEREISRMEAELALGGRRLDLPASPIPAFGSPTPSLTESMMATPKVDQSQSGTFLSPSSAGPPTPVLPPPSSTLERGNSQSSSLNEITPRTARRWSIVEVERAYERMRGMLGSTRSFCLSEAGENVSVEEAFETALRQAHSSGGSTGLADIEDDLVMLLTCVQAVVAEGNAADALPLCAGPIVSRRPLPAPFPQPRRRRLG